MLLRENLKKSNSVTFGNGVIASKGEWIITTEKGERDICQITKIADNTNFSEYLLERFGDERQNRFKLNKDELWEVDVLGIDDVRKIQVNDLGGGVYSLSWDDLVYYKAEDSNNDAEAEHKEFWAENSDEDS